MTWAWIMGRHGGQVPTEFRVRGCSCRLLPHILSCFKISSTRLLALKALKSLPIPWLWQRIHCFPKVHLQRLSNHHCWLQFNIFIWRGHRQKVLLRMHPNTPFQMKNSGEGAPQTLPWCGGVPTPHTLPLAPTKPSESAPASPRIPVRFTPLPYGPRSSSRSSWQSV